MFHEIASPPPTSGTALSFLLSALNSLGITANDPQGGIGISSDALNALAVDPAGFLLPRLGGALDAGIAGFSGPPADPTPCRSEPPRSKRMWTVRRSAYALPRGCPWALIGSATIDARVSLPSLAAALDLTLTLGAVTLTYAEASHRLTLDSPPWVNSLVLFPVPSPADLSVALNRAIPRILLSSTASALIEGSVGEGFSIAAIDDFLESPGAHAVSSSSRHGSCLDGSKINGLLQTIAVAAGMPPGAGLSLPGNIQLTAGGTNGVTLQLSTTHNRWCRGIPAWGADRLFASRHAIGNVIPDSAVAGGSRLERRRDHIRVDPSGISLAFAPQVNAPNPPIAPIQLLPTFSGLGAFGDAAKALLPSALDELVGALGPSPLLNASLQVAQAFDLYDAATGFKDTPRN